MADSQPIGDDGYLELLEDARSALYRLLTATEPGTGLELHRAYNNLKGSIGERGKAEARDEQKDRQRREIAEMDERHNVWRGMPMQRRESLLFQVLSDERLILRELTSRLNAELGAPDKLRHSIVYQGDVRSLVMRMFRAGLLERVEESFKNKPRYRYFRKRGLDGPIVDLDRAYHDDGGGES